jgi:pyruvate carboxylase subunit B
MNKRKIEFSLIYRDMWQSSGKYVPRVDQLVRIAPVIIEMGCFSRIETNGGAFEQVNLLFGENPNKAVREWVKPFNNSGIQTHMLERALNGIRMFPVPADVRRLMYKVKKAQGVDIARSFCGLNDHRNLELSIKYAKEAGMISQAALSITHSTIHSVDYYMQVVDKAVEYGTDEICLKDMAGIGRPYTLGKLVYAIKQKYPNIRVQYHGHSGPGFSVASILEVAKAGADYIDVAMEPLSWGMVHPDVITIREMLDDAGFEVPKINMNAYMEARALTQEFIDDFLGYFIDPKNRYVSSLMIDSGLPGGMMGSLMADLKGMHQAINMALEASGNRSLSEDELLIKLFKEVAFIWPMMGYPPLVTPFSQYVKNTALVNVLNVSQGKDRFGMIDENTWDMLLGKAGHLPGAIDPVFERLAAEQGREFFTGTPQEAYPDDLDKYRSEMIENGWETGPDDEELFEFAMHEAQYRDYKSGIAKQRFEEEIQKFKFPKNTVIVKENQAPNRSSYSKNIPDKNKAMLAFLLYSLNTGSSNNICKTNDHDVWKHIGFWRMMKQVHILHNGKEFSLCIESRNNMDYNIRIEDQSYSCTFLYAGKDEVDVRIDDENFYAKLSNGENSITGVTINGTTFEMKRMDILESISAGNQNSQAGAGSNFIKSPMPGKVFKLNVSEGDQVSKGDVLLVIESMKMENRIMSTKDAIVKKVNVKLNDMIEASTTLIIIEETE